MRRRRKSRPDRRPSGYFSLCSQSLRAGAVRDEFIAPEPARQRPPRSAWSRPGMGPFAAVADRLVSSPRCSKHAQGARSRGRVDAPRRRVGLALGAGPDPRVSALTKPRGVDTRRPAVRTEPRGDRAAARREDAAAGGGRACADDTVVTQSTHRCRNHRMALAAVWSSTPKCRAIAATVTPRSRITAASAAMHWYTGVVGGSRSSTLSGSAAKVRNLCERVSVSCSSPSSSAASSTPTSMVGADLARLERRRPARRRVVPPLPALAV